MKTATTIVRILLGALYIIAAGNFFLKFSPEPETTGAFKAFQVGIVASTYILPLAKMLELLCGISFVVGKYVTLANIIILPVTLNILLIHIYLTPEHLPIGLFIFLGNLFLIFSHWENYKTLFKP
jgi:putative oxidoreductase